MLLSAILGLMNSKSVDYFLFLSLITGMGMLNYSGVMKMEELKTWARENGLVDQWWVLVGETMREQTLAIAQANYLAESSGDTPVYVLHITQAEEDPAPWQWLEV